VTSRTLTFVGYGAILVAIVVMAVAAHRRPNWMTLPDALGALTRNRTVRVLVVIAWVWLGWHLFARGSGAFK
jgi:hypothetical protein